MDPTGKTARGGTPRARCHLGAQVIVLILEENPRRPPKTGRDGSIIPAGLPATSQQAQGPGLEGLEGRGLARLVLQVQVLPPS